MKLKDDRAIMDPAGNVRCADAMLLEYGALWGGGEPDSRSLPIQHWQGALQVPVRVGSVRGYQLRDELSQKEKQ